MWYISVKILNLKIFFAKLHESYNLQIILLQGNKDKQYKYFILHMNYIQNIFINFSVQYKLMSTIRFQF